MDAVTEPEDGSKGWLSSEVEAGLDLDGFGVLFLTIVAVRIERDDGTVLNEAVQGVVNVVQRRRALSRRIENFGRWSYDPSCQLFFLVCP